MVCAFEQRQAKRSAITWPVSVWHPQVERFYNGKSLNVSRRGALVLLPLRTPLREGQQLEMNFPRCEPLAGRKGGYARIKTARVIRIDRGKDLLDATVKVGLEFCPKPSLVPDSCL